MPLPSRCALSLVALATLAGYGCDETLTVDPQALVEVGTRHVTLDLGLGPFVDGAVADAGPDLADGADAADVGEMDLGGADLGEADFGDGDFGDGDFGDADFGEVDFGEADFSEVDFAAVDFGEADSGGEGTGSDAADIDAPDADGQNEGE